MKYDCPLIQDVMPLYKDGALSDSSRSFVEEHLKECPDCSALYSAEDTTKKETAQPITEPATVSAKALSKKIRRTRILIAVCVFTVISMLFGMYIYSYLGQGKTDGVKITIGTSTRFSRDELQSAADCILEKFKDFKGCTLKALRYDEDAYNQHFQEEEYRVWSRTSIVFFSDFSTDFIIRNGLEPNSTFTDWKWIVVRDSETGKWRVDGWGYC